MTTEAAERAARRITLELQNRVGMICAHGGILVTIGIMMILTGAPAPSEDWFGPYARLTIGAFATAGGLALLVGAALGDDRGMGWISMTVGTAAALLWHLGLAGTYAYAAATEDMVILSIGEGLGPEITSRGYIPLVYLGYVLLVAIHHITLLRLGPPPR